MKIGTTYEHFDKYAKLAERLGVEQLKGIVLGYIAGRLEIIEALELPKKHLNSIPLRKWDACHSLVVNLLRQAGGGSWSQSDTVCTLKHVAIYHIAGAEFVGTCTLCKKPFERYEGVRGDAICKTCMEKR